MSAAAVLADLVVRGRDAWAAQPAVDAPVHRVEVITPAGAELACGGSRTHGVLDVVGKFAAHRFWCVGCWGGGRS